MKSLILPCLAVIGYAQTTETNVVDFAMASYSKTTDVSDGTWSADINLETVTDTDVDGVSVDTLSLLVSITMGFTDLDATDLRAPGTKSS